MYPLLRADNVPIKRRLIQMLQQSQDSFQRWKQEHKEEKARRRELCIIIPNNGHWSEYSPVE